MVLLTLALVFMTCLLLKVIEEKKLMLVKVPPAQNQELVFVTLVISPDEFYVQRHSDNPQLSMVESELKV